MDITQRNCTPPRSQPPNEPPPPAPADPLNRANIQNLHPPLPPMPGQRRVGEAVVRTNPRLRQTPHQHQHHHQHHHHHNHQQQFHHMRERQFYLPRFLSEESLHQSMRSEASYGGQGGLHSSRIHSSADEISSVNRSPSVLSSRSSSDESFSRTTDFSCRTGWWKDIGLTFGLKRGLRCIHTERNRPWCERDFRDEICGQCDKWSAIINYHVSVVLTGKLPLRCNLLL